RSSSRPCARMLLSSRQQWIAGRKRCESCFRSRESTSGKAITEELFHWTNDSMIQLSGLKPRFKDSFSLFSQSYRQARISLHHRRQGFRGQELFDAFDFPL